MKKLILLICIVIISGCATNKYYYIKNNTANLIDDVLVNDTLKILKMQKITARSTIYLDFKLKNNYEKSLSEKLRLAGYAVKELDNEQVLTDTDIKLSYIVDYIEKNKNSEIIRLYLRMNDDRYTKAYAYNITDGFKELSSWSVNNVRQ